MMQTRWMSLLESVSNIVVGYGIAIATQVLIFPLFGIMASIEDNFLIAAIFTVVSLARSFALRRVFNRFNRIGAA